MKINFSHYWKKLKRWVAGDNALFAAFHSERADPKHVAKLLQDGFKTDVYGDGGYTPLQLSLLHDQYECTLVLLEQGADPNQRCLANDDSKIDRGKTLQPYLYAGPRHSPLYSYWEQQHISLIKLLMLYGTTRDGLRFYSAPLKKVALKAGVLYQEKQTCEDLLAHGTSADALRACRRLQEIWQQLSDEEVGDEPLQKTLRVHYQKKALFYAEKARQLTPAPAPSSPAPVTNSNLTEEVPCFSHPAHAYAPSNTLRKRSVSARELIYEEKVPLLKEYSQQPLRNT